MTNSKKPQDSLLKFLSDYLPLIIFFAVYKLSSSPNPLIPATGFMLVAVFIALVFSYVLTRKIATMPLVSGIILGVFGGLTIFLEDEIFIKIKPTIINCLFAVILFYGYFVKKPFLSYLIGESVKMSKDAWLTLSWRWAWFFLGLALVNELIWRNYSTDFWVQFKVFGMMPISLIFTISQVPFMMKEMKKFGG